VFSPKVSIGTPTEGETIGDWDKLDDFSFAVVQLVEPCPQMSVAMALPLTFDAVAMYALCLFSR
jgi:hypothetical protein